MEEMMKYIFGLIAIYALLSCNKFNRDKVLYSVDSTVDSSIDNTSWVLDSIDSFDIEDVLRLSFIDTFIQGNNYKYYLMDVYRPTDVTRTSVMSGLYVYSDPDRDYFTLGDVPSIKDNGNAIITLKDKRRYVVVGEKAGRGEIHFKWSAENKRYTDYAILVLSDIEEFLREEPRLKISEQVMYPLTEAFYLVFMNRRSKFLLEENRLVLVSEDKKLKIIWRKTN